uniref:Calmodulin-lysine N-methyltransferase n=1 Tax=Rhizophora mucronata TaxID=61149 RepID=A0A2P2J5X8_RHIMU
MTLHWDEEISSISNSFDVVVASDCTFFKDFHRSLACTVKLLLRKAGPSEAIFFSPKRGDSLDKFLKIVEEYGLHFSVTENYDTEVWRLHQGFMNGDNSWPAYEPDHCYPLLFRITL